VRIAERYEAVQTRIAQAATRAGRSPTEITLVGIAKHHPAEQVVEAVAAGLTHVGENFAQEARERLPRVQALLAERGLALPRWHFVGRLQRNKARLVAGLADCVESVDRESLAVALDRHAAAADRILEVCLQVDLSGEPQKGGVAVEQLPELLRAVAALPQLRPVGLMGVPAAHPDPEQARPAFARLRALRERLSSTPEGHTLQALSMGMSADFEVAIEEGASWIRVGTALFGARESTTKLPAEPSDTRSTQGNKE